jgi:hypothetical protein
MINILDLSEVERIINEISSAKNIERKRNAYISYEVESGLLGKYVQAKVKAMFPQTYKSYTISEYSLLKKVVDKKARAYKEPPIRKLDIDSESQRYSDFQKVNRFNDAMKDIDRIYNQYKYAGLYLELNEVDKKVNYYPLRPYEYDIVKNDKGEVICLILSYPGSQITNGTADKIIAGDRADDDVGEIEYVLWTAENHVVVHVTSDSVHGKKKVKMMPIEGNEEGVNPYGYIPFAYLPYDFNEDYPTPSPLANQTIEVNGSLSVYLTSGIQQVGQLIISGPSDHLPKEVAGGMMSAMTLPQSKNVEDKATTADYISPSPDLAGHKESIMTYLSMVLDEQGISSTQSLQGNEKFTSGLDRLLSQADVQAIIEDNQDSYVRFEQQIFETVNRMIGEEFSSVALQVTFKKPKMLTSDTDKLANIEKMLELGLIEEWEKFIEVDPNLSPEQAKEKLKRINENKSSALGSLIKMNNGANNGNGNGQPAMP